MSSTSSRESAASLSASNEPGCEPSRSVRSSPIAKPSSASTGQPCLAMPMSANSAASDYGTTGTPSASKSSAPDFRVRTPASAKSNGANEPGSMVNELASGEKSNDWPLTFDHGSSCWKTCQASLVPGLDRFSGTWPRSGLMRSGVAYLHPAAGLPHKRERVWILAYPRGSRLSRSVEGQSLLESAAAAFPQHGHAAAGAWRALDGDLNGLRGSDGISVAMERRRIAPLGNAVVPQIPEIIGRAILAAQKEAKG